MNCAPLLSQELLGEMTDIPFEAFNAILTDLVRIEPASTVTHGAGRHTAAEWFKRAGTSPVNAVVRETIMERQVHLQSSD